jgi:hypothetical protein
MALHIKSLLVISASLGLAGCTEGVTRWNQPAGAFLDEGQFGNPTMRNMQAMTQCVGKPKGYIVPEHVVVLNPEYSVDPKSPRESVETQYMRAQVRCSGDLNGKFAMIVFEEYVESGTEFPVREGGGLAEIVNTGG